MRIQDIIRGLLMKLDAIQQPEPETVIITQEPAGELSPLSITGGTQDEDELARMKQIAGLLPTPSCDLEYSNTPQEKYADIDAVTVDAGTTGWQAPKHPSDIRVQHPSAYPGHQHKIGE